MPTTAGPNMHRNHTHAGASERSKDQTKVEIRAAASRSHLDNDLYMDNFIEGLRHLQLGNVASEASVVSNNNSTGKISSIKKRTSEQVHDVGTSTQKAELLTEYAIGSGYCSELPRTVADGWIAGPANETGTALDVSHRPILCSSARWEAGEVVVGSSDHALYILDIQECTQKRRLQNRKYGHHEWVTCVTHLQDGSVLSGGMDSRLCLWLDGTSQCQSLEGHTGSISQVCQDKAGDVIASASYDKTIRLWNAAGICQECLQGHKAPILELQTDILGHIISGDRAGTVRLWDVCTGVCTWELKKVHKGHVTALTWADASGGNIAWLGCFATGGQDGRLRLWDPRAHSNVANLSSQAGKGGTGAVSGIIVGGAAAGYMAATCGADQMLRILDARHGIGELKCIELPDYPYSFTAAGGMLIVGCGNGALQIVDAHVMQTQYSLSASDSAVRCIQASKDSLVCAGDAGCAVFYSFTDR